MRSWTLVSPLALVLSACAGPPDGQAPGGSSGEISSTGGLPTTGEPTTGETSTGETTGAPSCCGCLCLDPDWSCGENTCTPEGGGAAPLGPEAGFLQVPAHRIELLLGADLLAGTAPPARLWYSFRPADDQPETRPLALFFNGGPGFSTAILFGLNTGPATLDPALTGDAEIAANPHSWTRFANLLYIDAPETGFSYNVALADGSRPELPFVAEHDASLVVQALLAFLAHHPAIAANPVIVVGESWGGVRASLMSHQLLFSSELTDSPVYRSEPLRAAVTGHLARVFPDLPADDPATAARQFGHRVLIQPSITHGVVERTELPHTQPDAAAELLACVGDFDAYQCDEPAGWHGQYTSAVVQRRVQPTTLSQALGLEVDTIAWMYASARTTAYLRWPLTANETEAQAALAEMFGPVPADGPYHLDYFIRGSLPDAYYEAHPGHARLFLRTLPYVRTFVTHARKDAVIYSLDLVPQLAWHEDLVASVEHDEVAVGDEARPGRIVVQYRPDSGLPALTHTIRFPRYEAAGHVVSVRAPGELLADVEAWYGE